MSENAAPDGWDYAGPVMVVECQRCAFEMGAIHVEDGKPTTCPCCLEASLRSRVEAAEARAGDLELMLRVELCDIYGHDRWCGWDRDGDDWILELWENRGAKRVAILARLKDDGTGLPLLDSAARAALKAGGGK